MRRATCRSGQIRDQPGQRGHSGARSLFGAGSETPVPRAGTGSSDGTIDSRDGYGPLTPVAGQATVVATAGRLRRINTPSVDGMAGAGSQSGECAARACS
jgi:hypothetical protein